MKEEKANITFRIPKSKIEKLKTEAERLGCLLTDVGQEAIDWYLAFSPETRDRVKKFAEQIRLPVENILEPIIIDYLAKLHVDLAMGKHRKLTEFAPRTNGSVGDDLFNIAVMYWQNEAIAEGDIEE